MNTKPCKGCGEPMIWARTSKGKRMPVDAEPITLRKGDDARVFQLHQQADGTVLAVYQRNATTGHVPHWATCPNADDFRRVRGRR